MFSTKTKHKLESVPVLGEHFQGMCFKDTYCLGTCKFVLIGDDTKRKRDDDGVNTTVPKKQKIAIECSICLETEEYDDYVIEDKEFHIFHRVCLKQWLTKHNTCPLCRSKLKNRNIKEITMDILFKLLEKKNSEQISGAIEFCMDNLITNKKIDVNNQTNKDGDTPLHYACCHGHLDIVQLLLQSNAIDVNQTNNNGETPLHYACRYGYLDIVQLLLQNNAIDVNQTNNDGDTPLHYACINGYLDTVQLLLQNSVIDVNQTNNNGETPLHYACRYGHLNIVQWLLQNNADINKGDKNGRTPLYIACEKGHLDVVKYIISQYILVKNSDINLLHKIIKS
jgi:ankyrin repeat protein